MTSRIVVKRKPEVECPHRMLHVALVVLCSCLAIVVGQRRGRSEGQGQSQGQGQGQGQSEDLGDCSAVEDVYRSKGFSGHDVPPRMIAGNHLLICQLQYTCCTQEMEEKLNLRSSHDINQLIMDKLDSYRQTFVTRLLKFDDYFVELIDQSRISLHNMFLRTYGQLYEQNVQIFVDLFDGLQSLYRSRTSAVDVQDVLDRFFGRLMRRIFCLLNGDRQFDDEFFVCIGEYMDQLRPFGDIPIKLRLQMKRSFAAARAFVDGLGAGRDVILAMSKFEHGDDCLHELMRLTYCSLCGGFVDMRPCGSSCLVVLKGCFSHYAEINHLWNSYLGEMTNLAMRLDGAFNMETVVTPLGVKLSEAIMLFQENSDSFSSKVFQGCDEPKLHNHSNDSQNETAIKRDLSTESLGFDAVTTQSPNPMLQSLNHSTFGSGKANLSRLIRDAQGKLQAMRDSWKNLPELLCNETSLAVSDDLPTCWNGSAVLRKSNNERVNEFNEDALSSLARHGNILQKELYQLRVIIYKIRNAHNGISEELADDDPSGSGDESGSGIDDADQLKTSRDIYIDRISSPQESTIDLIMDVASTGRPLFINAASCIHFDLQTGRAWPMAVLIVIRGLLLRF